MGWFNAKREQTIKANVTITVELGDETKCLFTEGLKLLRSIDAKLVNPVDMDPEDKAAFEARISKLDKLAEQQV